MEDDDAALLAAIRRLKIENPDTSAKEIHVTLLAAGHDQDLPLGQVKKLASKVVKALAKEDSSARQGDAAEASPLITPPADCSTAFIRCQHCQKPVKKPKLCAGCQAVAYCGPICFAADTEHHGECSSYARHMQRDVGVSLPGAPAWVSMALGHRANMDWCSLLEGVGIHDDTYGLLCGCVRPANPHRSVPNPLDLVADPAAKVASHDAAPPVLWTWADYYAWRGLPSDSTVALLLSWPLTVFFSLSRLGLAGLKRAVTVHYLGPEKEVMFLPMMLQALSELLPAASLNIEMVGPLGIALPASMTRGGALGGSITIKVHRGLYHAVGLPKPDVAIAPNAGLSVVGYGDRWPETLRYIHDSCIPFVFTDYSEQSVEKGLALAANRFGMVPSSGSSTPGGDAASTGVILNPFRMPLREPLVRGGAVGFPTVSNGFLAAFHTPPGAFIVVDSEHTDVS